MQQRIKRPLLERIKDWIRLSPVPLSKNHHYDILTRKIISTRLKPDSNCIDVGCHKGEIMDIIVKAAPNGHHFGLEPIPDFFYGLKAKYSDNAGVTIIDKAASNQTGTSTFNYVTSNPSYSGLRKRAYDRKDETDETITVDTELLDRMVPEDMAFDLIKIDVEGAELFVLEGARKILERSKPLVIFEHGKGASEFYDTSPENIYDFFSRHDMRISNLSRFLKNGTPLSRSEFIEQYEGGKHYNFIAS